MTSAAPSSDDNRSPPTSDFCVHLYGFSDQLLRFIAEHGSIDQLRRVQRIDSVYELDVPVASDRDSSKYGARRRAIIGAQRQMRLEDDFYPTAVRIER
jgi:hypothetical protein